MARRAGSADLPLHGGQVPRWLADRMTRLGAVMSEAIVHHYGRDELLRRLAHPFWFQSFGAVMGMDWHSSGVTTSVIGALKAAWRRSRMSLGFMSVAAAGSIRGKLPKSSSQSGNGWDLTDRRSPTPAGSSPRWTAPPCRMALISICTDSS